MHTGYHLRFLKVDPVTRSIEGADIVRVAHAAHGPFTLGVQLHARPTPPPPSRDMVLRLTRSRNESERAFVTRAFREAALRQRQLQEELHFQQVALAGC